MTSVASLAPCRELYELSGWDDTDFGHQPVLRPGYEGVHRVVITQPKSNNIIPAYDLGYLLRKLPPTDESGDHWEMWRSLDGMSWIIDCPTLDTVNEATPEDAAAKLAIELFKRGVLKKDQS